MTQSTVFASIEEAIESYRAGRMVIIVDDEDRENEGDLAIAAEKISPETINFMARHGRGLICLSLTAERCDELRLSPMAPDNTSPFGTAFTVSIEARGKTTTGISASDRAATILTAVDPSARPEDLVRPGHVFPLRARPGGVLERRGQTEASLDLARLAGLTPAGVICEVMNEDGTMARLPELTTFAAEHDLPIVRVTDLAAHRLRTESIVERVATPRIPTDFGEFQAIAYRSIYGNEEHLALVMGDLTEGAPPVVRIHSQCLTGDVFGSCRCDCGPQLQAAMAEVSRQRRGAIVYLLQEGRGIGLFNKLRAYELQEKGYDTVEANKALGFPADARDYGMAAQILRDLGVRSVRLLTNNPGKQTSLETYGVRVEDRVPLEITPTDSNREYLRAKREKLGHRLSKV